MQYPTIKLPALLVVLVASFNTALFGSASTGVSVDESVVPPTTGAYGIVVSSSAFGDFIEFSNYSFAGHTMYKVSVTTANADDLVIAVFGDDDSPLELVAPAGIYNSYFAAGVEASQTMWDVNNYDSFVTIGLPAGNIVPSSNNEAIAVTGQTELGAIFHPTSLYATPLSVPVDYNSALAGDSVAWSVSSSAANAIAGADLRVEVLQVNSPGLVSGQIHAIVYPHGVAENAIIVRGAFSGSVVTSVGVMGCNDESACNYNSMATQDNGSCLYPEPGYECDDTCTVDTDGDGVCDEFEVVGCMNSSYCNFDPLATDAGECTGTITWYEDADGDGVGDANSTQDACTAPAGYVASSGDNCPNDGNKIEPGDCGCGSPDEDVDGDQITDCLDLCTDSDACNFLADPSEACTYAAAHYSCAGTCLNDSDGDGVCDELEVLGCTTSSACNYDAAATEDDASCTYPLASHLDCDGNCLNDADGDGECDEFEIDGCTDPIACNYSVSATNDTGICTYCDCAPTHGLSPYSLTVEVEAVDGVPGQTTYRFYVNTVDERDMVNALFADATHPFELTSDSDPNWYQTAAPYGVNFGVNVESGFFTAAPDLEYDSWFTLGAQNSIEAGGLAMYASPGSPMAAFNSGSDISVVGSTTGFSLYTSGTCNRLASPGDADYCPSDYPPFGGTDGRVLIAQITSEGTLSGSISVSILPNGIPAGQYLPKTFVFDGVGTFSSNDWSGPSVSAYQDCGCTDETAINFDQDALYLDDSCIATVVGCMEAGACNYDSSANTADDSCEYVSCAGCTDSTACNYDSAATISADVCEFALEHYDCDGNCLEDANNNQICDPLEVHGCTNNAACNFNATANVNDDSCILPATWYEDADGDGAGDASVTLDACSQPEGFVADASDLCPADSAKTAPGDCGCGEADLDTDADGLADCNDGCTDTEACNYMESAASSCDYAVFAYDCDGVCLADSNSNNICDPLEVWGCMDLLACNFQTGANVDDESCTYELTWYLDSDGDGAGDADATMAACDQPAGYVSNATDQCPDDANKTEPGACGCGFSDEDVDGDGLSDCNDQCTDSAACNYLDSAALLCEYPEAHYDCAGACLFDANNNGICDPLEVPGCMDNVAANYDSGANVDDGGCLYYGCTNHFACNFDPNAGVDDGTCSLPIPGYDCDGLCVIDTDGDGTCDAFEIYGCTDSTACNFNSAATENFCCQYPDGVTHCDGTCVNDADGDGVCDENEVLGCTDSAAWNFNAQATDDDGFCIDIDPEIAIDAAYFDGLVEGAEAAYGGGYDDGYEDGLADGETTGYDAGYAAGDSAGYASGYAAGSTDGYDVGYAAGDSAGYVAGYDAGLAAGQGSGYDVGFDDGYTEGYSAGNSAGYASGYADGLLAGELACVGSAFCGEDTEWHDDLQVCLPMSTCMGDLNGDGIRGIADLLQILGVFGDECE